MNIKIALNCVRLIALLCSNIAAVQASSEMILVKAESGCNFYTPAHMSEGFKAIPDIKLTWIWTGECVGDFAQGMGTTSLEYKNQYVHGTHVVQQRHHAGYPVGYGKYTAKSKSINVESWIFSYQGQMVSFGGLGLEGSENLLNSTSILFRSENLNQFRKNISLLAHNKLFSFYSSHCGLHKERFPECGFGEGEKKYDVYMISESQISGNNKKDYDSASRTFCPDPKDGPSCIPFASSRAASYRTAILVFIAQSKTGVEDTYVRMNAVLAAAGKAVPSISSYQASSSIQNPQGTAQTLEILSVGQMFSLADEYESKGDKATTRTILRKLVERFPNHPLAELAAKQLENMPSN